MDFGDYQSKLCKIDAINNKSTIRRHYCQTKKPGLTNITIDLSEHEIDLTRLKELTDALQNNTTVRALKLEHCFLSDMEKYLQCFHIIDI